MSGTEHDSRLYKCRKQVYNIIIILIVGETVQV